MILTAKQACGLLFIGGDVEANETSFDTAYMRRLYNYDYKRGLAGGI